MALIEVTGLQGIPRKPRECHGSHGIPWAACNSMKLMRVRSIPWSSWISRESIEFLGSHGSPWKPYNLMGSMGFHRISWNESHGSWNYMEFHGTRVRICIEWIRDYASARGVDELVTRVVTSYDNPRIYPNLTQTWVFGWYLKNVENLINRIPWALKGFSHRRWRTKMFSLRHSSHKVAGF